MAYLMYFAALLLVFVAFAHSYLGERYLLTRLFKRDNLPVLFGSDDFTKKTLRFAWHITSIAWLGFACIILLLTQPEQSKQAIAAVIAITFLLHFLVALLGSRGKHLSWVVFLLVALLLFFGVAL